MNVHSSVRMAAVLITVVVAAAFAEIPAEERIVRLMEIAVEHSPALRIALARRAEAAAASEGVKGFWDPRLAVETGYADRRPAMPLLSPGVSRFDHAAWFTASVETALVPGLYGGVGVSYQDATEDPPAGRIMEHGLYARIPLWRDRGSALWRAERDTARYAYRQRNAELDSVWQDLRREIELHYIELQWAWAQHEAAIAAMERAIQLMDNAEQLVALGAVPAYQLDPARLEAARRREEVIAAETAVRNARRRLAERLGADPPEALMGSIDLVAWARAAAASLEPPGLVLDRRGDIRAARESVAFEEAQLQRAQEEGRAELALHALLGVRDSSSRAGAEATETDGGQWMIGASWRRTLSDRAARARVEAARHRLAAQREALRQLEQRAVADIEVFFEEAETARRRLELAEEMVEAARRSVSAEEERFQLGEGTSRLALDAQKDLTEAVRRRNQAAAEFLRAAARLRHAQGTEAPELARRTREEGPP